MNDSPPVTVKAETLSGFIQGNKAIRAYEGLVIAGDLNLADLTYDHKLTLRKCTFQGHVDATDCHFKKTVDLSGSTFEKGISFAGAYVDHLIAPGCKFNGPFAANEVRFDQSVDLGGCVFAGSVNFQGTRIAGNLLLNDAVIKKTGGWTCLELMSIEGNLIGNGLQAETYLDFTNATIRGKTDFSPSKQQPMRCKGDLYMSGTKFSGEVVFNKAEIHGSMFMEEAEIHSSLRCNDIQLKKRPGEDQTGDAVLRGLTTSGLVGFARCHLEGNLDLQSVEIRGGMFFEEAQIDGFMKMPAAKVRTTVNFSGARFGTFLSMVVATVEGNVFLDDIKVGWKGPTPEKNAADIKEELPEENVGRVFLAGLRVTDELQCNRAHVRGNLEMSVARIGGNLFLGDSRIEHMLDLANAEIQGSLWFNSNQPDRDAFVGGLAWLSGAKIGGAVNLKGLVIGDNLNLTSLVVKEYLHLDEDGYGRPARITGEVDFSAGNVTGGVQMNGVQIGRGMKAVAVEVSGGLLCPSMRIGGPVDFSGCKVSGRVEFQQAHLEGSAVFALANVDGDVQFQDARVAGDFNLKDASIQGELVCRDMQVAARANAEDKASAYMTGLKVTGDVDFSGAKVEGRLALDRAAIDGRLRFSFCADPPTQVGGRLFLNACSVRHADFAHQPDGHHPAPYGARLASKLPKVDLQGFQFQELDVPEKNYIGFLARTEPFRQTSYVLIEQWLRNRGKDKEAESIFFAMRDRSNKEAMANRSFARKFINRVWRRTSRIFLFVAFRSFFLILLALGLFGLTVFVFSDQRSVTAKSDFGGQAETWDVVKSVRLALNIHFPGAPISLLDHWQPSNEVLWHCDWIPGCPFNITYQDYAHAAWWVTYVAVLPLLGIGFLIKWSRRRAAETPG